MTKKLITLSIAIQIGLFATNTFAQTTSCTCVSLEQLGYRGYACCSVGWNLSPVSGFNWTCKQGSSSTDAFVQTNLAPCNPMSSQSPSKNFLKK